MKLLKKEREVREPSLIFSLVTFICVIAVMIIGMKGLGGSLCMVLLVAWFVIFIAGWILGYKFTDMEKMAYKSIGGGLGPIMIVMVVGVMVGTWILSGTIPSLIYFGIKVISPNFFYITTFILCAIMSLCCGTSWGTIGSAGLALIGVCQAMDLNMGCAAAAIVTGAYFGDKLSPLSDTTNLAASISKGTTMNHVKHMMWTTVPSFVISAILYLIIGLKDAGQTLDADRIRTITDGLQANFHISLLPLLPALLVLILLLLNMPSIPSLASATGLAAVIAIFYQGSNLKEVFTVFYSGYSSETGIAEIDAILNRGGLNSMWSTMGVFVFALGLAGMLSQTGILGRILEPLQKRANTPRRLIFLTMIVSYVANAIGASLLFAISITGALMEPMYEEQKLRPENLSRTLEDTATMSAALIPWNTGAIYAVGTLGVAVGSYAPFCFLFFLAPVFTIIYAVSGKTICYLDAGEKYGEATTYKSTFNPNKRPEAETL